MHIQYCNSHVFHYIHSMIICLSFSVHPIHWFFDPVYSRAMFCTPGAFTSKWSTEIKLWIKDKWNAQCSMLQHRNMRTTIAGVGFWQWHCYYTKSQMQEMQWWLFLLLSCEPAKNTLQNNKFIPTRNQSYMDNATFDVRVQMVNKANC